MIQTNIHIYQSTKRNCFIQSMKFYATTIEELEHEYNMQGKPHLTNRKIYVKNDLLSKKKSVSCIMIVISLNMNLVMKMSVIF